MVGLTARIGREVSTEVLADIDAYHAERPEGGDSVLTALVPRLSDPSPRDRGTTTQLAAYQNLHARWLSWADVVAASRVVADGLLKQVEGDLACACGSATSPRTWRRRSPVGRMRHWSPRGVDRARRDAEQHERAAVAEQVRAPVARSGLPRAEFASRIGTSRPRLSTYCTGSVTPSAALVERMRALVDRMSDG